MTHGDIRLPEMGIACALGWNRKTIRERLFSAPEPGLEYSDRFLADETSVPVGRVSAGLEGEPELPEVPSHLSEFDCRNNRLALLVLNQIRQPLESALNEAKAGDVGIVMGTSTSGVENSVHAVRDWKHTGTLPDSFHYHQMEMGGLAEFLGRYLDVEGVRYTIPTSCSSSAKVFAAARSLIENGVCETVLAGGVDSLSRLTLNGFYSLQLLSTEPCNPMSSNRNGINIGEGGALFLMTEDADGPALLGVGESSDAHRMNAPDPEGHGAQLAMEYALRDAGLNPSQVDYLNLHGTGTEKNDAMEAKATHRLFGSGVSCSSTKPFTGHTLGAAGAVEAGFCWMMLERYGDDLPMPPHLWDGHLDRDLPELDLVPKGGRRGTDRPVLMSNSFAFGGNNCSVIIGRTQDD